MSLVGLPIWGAERRVQSSAPNVDGVPDSIEFLEVAATQDLLSFNEPGTYGTQNPCYNWYIPPCSTVTNEVTPSSTAAE